MADEELTDAQIMEELRKAAQSGDVAPVAKAKGMQISDEVLLRSRVKRSKRFLMGTAASVQDIINSPTGLGNVDWLEAVKK